MLVCSTIWSLKTMSRIFLKAWVKPFSSELMWPIQTLALCEAMQSNHWRLKHLSVRNSPDHWQRQQSSQRYSNNIINKKIENRKIKKWREIVVFSVWYKPNAVKVAKQKQCSNSYRLVILHKWRFCHQLQRTHAYNALLSQLMLLHQLHQHYISLSWDL